LKNVEELKDVIVKTSWHPPQILCKSQAKEIGGSQRNRQGGAGTKNGLVKASTKPGGIYDPD